MNPREILARIVNSCDANMVKTLFAHNVQDSFDKPEAVDNMIRMDLISELRGLYFLRYPYLRKKYLYQVTTDRCGRDIICFLKQANDVVYDLEILLNEYFIGIFVNQMRDLSFVQTYGVRMARKLRLLGVRIEEEKGEGKAAMLMLENIQGREFFRVMIEDSFPLSRMIKILINIFSALDRAYQIMEFTHYDLAPNNILVVENDEIKIIDLAHAFIRIDGVGYGSDSLASEVGCYGVDNRTSFPAHDFFKLIGYSYGYLKKRGSVEHLEFLDRLLDRFNMRKLMDRQSMRTYYALAREHVPEEDLIQLRQLRYRDFLCALADLSPTDNFSATRDPLSDPVGNLSVNSE